MTSDPSAALGSARDRRDQRQRGSGDGAVRARRGRRHRQPIARARRGCGSSPGIPKAYGSYDELLADPDIDAVYIPLPNFLHRSGSWPLRPRASTSCARSPWPSPQPTRRRWSTPPRPPDVVLAEAFMYGHHPRYDRLHEIVRSGEIGEVRSISGTFTFDASDETRPDGLRRAPGRRRRLRRRLLRHACSSAAARHRTAGSDRARPDLCRSRRTST